MTTKSQRTRTTLLTLSFITLVSLALIVGVILNQPKKYYKIESNNNHEYVIDTDYHYAIDPDTAIYHTTRHRVYLLHEDKYITAKFIEWRGVYYVYR